jgi:hypothetical protein
MAKTEYRWNIFLLRATPATPIGSLEAPDAASEIKKAIELYEITDPRYRTASGTTILAEDN